MGVLHVGVGAVRVRAVREAPLLRGRSTLKAYPRGLIPKLMAMGMRARLSSVRLSSPKSAEAFESARASAEKFVVYRSEVGNLIVTAGKVLVCRMLIDDGAQWDVGLTYHAIGTSSTTPSLSDTQLGTEVERKQPTLKTRAGNEITLSTFYPAADCTYAIEEAGIFGSSTAGASADSGELFSRYLQSYDNSAGDYDLTFDYVLTVA